MIVGRNKVTNMSNYYSNEVKKNDWIFRVVNIDKGNYLLYLPECFNTKTKVFYKDLYFDNLDQAKKVLEKMILERT